MSLKQDPTEVPSTLLSSQRLANILLRQVELHPQVSLEELVRVAVLQISRPGQIGSSLNGVLRLRLVQNLINIIQTAHDKKRPEQVCNELAEIVFVETPKIAPRSLSGQAKFYSSNSAKQINKRVHQALVENHVFKEDVDRLATDIFKANKKNRQGIRRMNLKKDDPMRSVWGFQQTQKIDLASTDVRHKILDGFSAVKNTQGKSLADTLREASVFRPEVLKSALGDLWKKGQPVGFVDRRKTILLIRVAHAADAQELSLCQNEFLDRLRGLPGFDQLKKVRFEVKPSAHL